MSKKILKKSKNDKIIAGVLGGAAKYFDVDPTLARVFFLIFLAFTGFMPGVALYLLAIAIMPPEKK